MMTVSKQLDKSFAEYDQYFKRGGLNFTQFSKMMQDELKIAPSVLVRSERAFLDEIRLLGEEPLLVEQGLIGLTGVKRLLVLKG